MIAFFIEKILNQDNLIFQNKLYWRLLLYIFLVKLFQSELDHILEQLVNYGLVTVCIYGFTLLIDFILEAKDLSSKIDDLKLQLKQILVLLLIIMVIFYEVLEKDTPVGFETECWEIFNSLDKHLQDYNFASILGCLRLDNLFHAF